MKPSVLLGRIALTIAIAMFCSGARAQASAPAAASNYPAKPVRLVVPFPAGASSDVAYVEADRPEPVGCRPDLPGGQRFGIPRQVFGKVVGAVINIRVETKHRRVRKRLDMSAMNAGDCRALQPVDLEGKRRRPRGRLRRLLNVIQNVAPHAILDLRQGGTGPSLQKIPLADGIDLPQQG